MLTFQMIGKAVQARRQEVGLTQTHLAKLADLSRETVQQLEEGTINDLGFAQVQRLLSVLGLSFNALSIEARKAKQGLWMAAKTSSVSYRQELTSEQLEAALCTGEVPSGLESNLLHLLEEAPVQIVVMAVEEAAKHQSIDPAKIWANVAILAKELGARGELWE